MDEKHATLTYIHTGLVDAILTPVELFSDVYDEVTSYLTNALWDTGAMVSVISPENEMIIGMDVITQMDIAITNGRGQTQFSFAILPFENRIDFANR